MKKKNKPMMYIALIVLGIYAFSNSGFLGSFVPGEHPWSIENYVSTIHLGGIVDKAYGQDSGVCFNIKITGTTNAVDRGYICLDKSQFKRGMTTSPGAGRKPYIRICSKEGVSMNIENGEYLHVVGHRKNSGGLTTFTSNSYIYLPELKGDLGNYPQTTLQWANMASCIDLWPTLSKAGQSGTSASTNYYDTYWDSDYTNIAGFKVVSGCTVTSWAPDTNSKCEGEQFLQESNCGDKRTATGTKNDCAVCDIPIGYGIDNNVCIEMVGCEGQSGDYTTLAQCQADLPVDCIDVRDTLDGNVINWVSGAISRDALGQSIMDWVNCNG